MKRDCFSSQAILLGLTTCLIAASHHGAAAGAGSLFLDFENSIYRHLNKLLPRQGASSSRQLQPWFSGQLGGPLPPVTNSGNPQRPFFVVGETIDTFSTAVDKACDGQFEECQRLANLEPKPDFEVSDCNQQNEQCKSSGKQPEVERQALAAFGAGGDGNAGAGGQDGAGGDGGGEGGRGNGASSEASSVPPISSPTPTPAAPPESTASLPDLGEVVAAPQQHTTIGQNATHVTICDL